MSRNIVVVGSLNMDLVVRAPRHPQPGETILGDQFGTFPGGKGANQAVAAARLGAAVTMIGRVGEDAFGDALVQSLVDNHVDTSHILRCVEAATGVALITLDAAGQNTIVVAPGANTQLTPEDISEAEDVLAQATILLLQLEIPLPTVARAIKVARKHGVKVVLNPAPAQPLDETLLRQVDYLIPNRSELALLAEANIVYSAPDALSRLRAKGASQVVVTLGENGVLAGDGNEIFSVPVGHQVNVVDTTAAGDAFVGAFAVALSEGCTLREAAVWGNAAGAITVTRQGAQPSLPTREEVEKMVNGGRA